MVKLRDEASRGPVSSDVPKLAEFLAYWLKEIVEAEPRAEDVREI